MSTKSTIFLTEDNEHCYSDCSLPHGTADKREGDSIVLELSKENINILCNDQWDLVIEFKNPNSAIYKKIKSLQEP